MVFDKKCLIFFGGNKRKLYNWFINQELQTIYRLKAVHFKMTTYRNFKIWMRTQWNCLWTLLVVSWYWIILTNYFIWHNIWINKLFDISMKSNLLILIVENVSSHPSLKKKNSLYYSQQKKLKGMSTHWCRFITQ